MTRDQVEHVLRAAAAITRENSFVVLGSQSILFAYPDAPAELCASRELDLYPAMTPGLADLIDGAIGALSQFEETFMTSPFRSVRQAATRTRTTCVFSCRRR